MTQQEKQIRLAQSHGWLDIHRRSRRGKRCDDGLFLYGTYDPDSVNYPREYSRLPDYFGDLNAAAYLEQKLDFCTQGEAYWQNLATVLLGGTDDSIWETKHSIATAPASFRADAVGVTLGLWGIDDCD